MKFSISFFSAGGKKSSKRHYELLMDLTKFADDNGFHAVWIPERHFQEFGGIFPNPSIIAAAVAVTTERVRIRAGSVVFPLHHPLRIVEEWGLVDNLSEGRVDISMATGWHPADFILTDVDYKHRRAVAFERLDLVRALWRGEKKPFKLPNGDEEYIECFPRPLQRELNTWVTTSGNPETWRMAGELGSNILGSLISETIPTLSKKIEIFRSACSAAGHNPENADVSVMLHTFVTEDASEVENYLHPALQDYIRAYIRQKEDPNIEGKRLDGIRPTEMSETSKADLTQFAARRYIKEKALVGSVDQCVSFVRNLADAKVTEVSCLVDFGLDHDLILSRLGNINKVREIAAAF